MVTVIYKYTCLDGRTMRVSVEAYGCTLNQGESRLMEELLEDGGHEIVPSEDAQASLIVTCCVIGSTERKMLKRIKELNEKDRKIFVGGCMASIMKEKVRAVSPEAVFVSPKNLEEIIDKVGEVEGIPARRDRGERPTDSIDAIVPIGQGCTEQCSYCVTRLARGSLESYPEDDLLDVVRRRLLGGSKEIRLTAQDTASYGKDIGTSLPSLLSKVTSLDGEFRVRVGMANITNLLPVLDETLEAYDSEKVYKFLHVPVQSGSDKVLNRMKRRYSVLDFKRVCEAFRERFPDSSISTDIITGFPGETEEDSRSSIELMKEVRPEIINVTRFSAREGTEAFEMDDQVPGWMSKERSRELTKLRMDISLEKNDSLIGDSFRVMTTEYVKEGTTVGRTDSYRPVVLPEHLPLGSFYEVNITSATDAYLNGRRE